LSAASYLLAKILLSFLKSLLLLKGPQNPNQQTMI
jgi:hypothetical protein